MSLKILLPYQIFAERTDVTRIVAETASGSFGLLPQRLDCVATIVPGILSYATMDDGQVYVAVDEGVLVKTGPKVSISVRRAFSGPDLRQLRDTVEHEFLALSAQERSVRQVMTKLETGLLRRFVDMHHGQR
jgi:F-type H+-transporting ATPase subunit epsilon